MEPVSAVAIYFIIWWLTLFIVLPWGASSAHELGQEVEPGSAKGAPVKPRMKLKFGITTVLAAIIFAIVYFVLSSGVIELDDVPFFPHFPSITD
jgi:predicted secreted protein